MLLFGKLTNYKWEVEQKQFLRKENNLLYRTGRAKDLMFSRIWLPVWEPSTVFRSNKTQLSGAGEGGADIVFLLAFLKLPSPSPKKKSLSKSS